MAWYNEMGNESDTVLSSRIRFARNLSGYPFDGKLTEADAKEIIKKVTSAFDGKGFSATDMLDVSELQAASLVEKHLISREFAAKNTPHSLLLNESTSAAVMICEEDHIRLQTLLPGLALEEAYRIACEYDDIIDSSLDIAYDNDLGYLTHCPTNLGTGMRASVMMFLPALTMANRISALASQLSKIGLTMRGIYGEGSESRGYLYQISNQITLGITEEDTLKKLGEVISQISGQERKLRLSIRGENLERLKDSILRSEGILKYANMISSSEFTEHFSNIRLGIALGIVTDISYVTLGSLFVSTLPATLTLNEKEPPKTDFERDRARAKLVKATLGK